MNQARRKQKQGAKSAKPIQPAPAEPIGADNKGFKLLAAQGYKPGQGLGAQEQGMPEPIHVEVRQKRSGLGVDEARREEEARARVREQEHQAKRARTEAQAAVAYTQSARSGFQIRKLQGQMKDAWRACETLEMQAQQQPSTRLSELLEDSPQLVELLRALGLMSTEPTQPHTAQVEVGEDDDDAGCACTTAPPPSKYRGANPPQEPQTATSDRAAALLLDGEVLQEQLGKLHTFLRGHFNYCMYCGCSYDNQEDLNENCPGPEEDDH